MRVIIMHKFQHAFAEALVCNNNFLRHSLSSLPGAIFHHGTVSTKYLGGLAEGIYNWDYARLVFNISDS